MEKGRRKKVGSRLCVLLGLIAVLGMARAEWTFEYMEGRKCDVGGDVRVRLTHFDRDVASQDGALPDGPAFEYLRVRERLWGCFHVGDTSAVNVRLVNRWHHFSSRPGDNSSDDGSRWTFPDEVAVDKLNLAIAQVMGTSWDVTIGRQDIVLGNGMIVLEGTPYDQGRTIYFDGVTATYKGEADTLTLLATYNEYKDTTVFINDQNRRLRRGDTWLVGAYWTHMFNSLVNTDLYYLWMDVDDDEPDSVEQPNHPADENAILHIFGARVFGALHEQVDYSIEVAKEEGDMMAADVDADGLFVDGRLTLKAPKGTKYSPELDLQVAHFSGDDPDTADEYEGWHPVFSEYPIWREELSAITFNGHWTNLTRYRSALRMQLYDSEKLGVKCMAAVDHLEADHGEVGTGGGDTIGQIYSAFLDFAVKEYNLSFALEAAQIEPGDFFADGHTAEWLRFQTVWTF